MFLYVALWNPAALFLSAQEIYISFLRYLAEREDFILFFSSPLGTVGSLVHVTPVCLSVLFFLYSQLRMGGTSGLDRANHILTELNRL